MKRKYPFLPVFGRADTRERCIRSAQRVFNRLLLRTPSARKLPFSTIALLAKNDDDGRMNKNKLRELIRIFRPDRDGKLRKLDFVRSIDSIYRDLRKLSLNIEDNVQIDRAVEYLIDLIFYTIVGSIVLNQLGIDPFQVFVSLSSLILGTRWTMLEVVITTSRLPLTGIFLSQVSLSSLDQAVQSGLR